MKTTLPTLSFMKGLPSAVVCLFIAVMYKHVGMSNTTAVLLASTSLIGWVLRPLWRPFIDITLSRRLWLIMTEVLLSLIFYSVCIVLEQRGGVDRVWMLFVALSIVGATHDVAVVNYMLEHYDKTPHERMLPIKTIFSILPFMFTLGLMVMIAGNMQVLSRQIESSWAFSFRVLSIVTASITLYHIIVLRRKIDSVPTAFFVKPRAWKMLIGRRLNNLLRRTRFMPVMILLTIAMLPTMMHITIANIFLIERSSYGGLGMTPQEYSYIVGTIGVIAFMVGVLAIKYLFQRFRYKMMLPISMIIMIISNCSVLFLSMNSGQNIWSISVLISLQALGLAAGVTGCRSVVDTVCCGHYSAAHRGMVWALLVLMLIVSMSVASIVQPTIGYTNFFVLTTLLGVATVVSSIILTRLITHYFYK